MTRHTRRSDFSSDEGSVLLLGIGWLMVCLFAVIVMIDASAVMVQRQQLQAACDAAALAGAQAIDFDAYYEHGATGATRLDPVAVRARVDEHLRLSDAYQALPGLHVSRVWTDGMRVQVRAHRPLDVPILPPGLPVVLPQTSVESWARLSLLEPAVK